MATRTKAENDLEAKVQAMVQRPYRKVVQRDPEDGYLALAPDLPGCIMAGATEAEALENLREAMEAWLESTIASGQSVPEPSPMPSLPADLGRYSGRMLVRMPRSLHRQLIERAEQEGVSANQLAVALLAEALGRRQREFGT